MAFIPSNQLRPTFTSDLAATYRGSLPAHTALQNKFKRVTKDTLFLEINVQRYAANVAQDVVRGTDGNRNQFAKMVMKIDQPPLYHEYLDIMQLEGYNRAFGSVSMSASAYRDFRETAIFNMKQLVNKIDRAYELQAASVFINGVINTVNNGPTDFLRNAASIVPYSAGIDWSIATVNPKDIIKRGCVYVSTIGQADGGVFDCWMGDGAFDALVNNPIIQNESQKLWRVLTKFEEPDMRGDGSVFQGQMSVGSFKVNIWTYPKQYNNDPANPRAFTTYFPDNMILVLPPTPDFIHAFAMVPQLPSYMGLNESGITGSIGGRKGSGRGQYFVSEFVDQKATAWYAAIKSAGMVWPVGVDQMFNAYVLP